MQVGSTQMTEGCLCTGEHHCSEVAKRHGSPLLITPSLQLGPSGLVWKHTTVLSISLAGISGMPHPRAATSYRPAGWPGESSRSFKHFTSTPPCLQTSDLSHLDDLQVPPTRSHCPRREEGLRSLTMSTKEHVEVMKTDLVWKWAAKGSWVPSLFPGPLTRAGGPNLGVKAAAGLSPPGSPVHREQVSAETI